MTILKSNSSYPNQLFSTYKNNLSCVIRKLKGEETLFEKKNMGLKNSSIEKNMKIIMVLILVIMMKGYSSAKTKSFPLCYGKCMFFCAVFGQRITCPANCLFKCYIQKKFSKKKFYCCLGCALTRCSKFGRGKLFFYYLHKNM